jgi:FtsZ-interacting cell division protein YlmF
MLWEKIRELVRERKETGGKDEEVSPTKRVGGENDTEAEAADAIADSDSSDKELIIPEDDIAKYDKVRLQRGVSEDDKGSQAQDYSSHKRVPQENASAHIKTARADDAKREASVAVVQALDEVYYSKIFFFKPRKEDEHESLMQYVKLRRWGTSCQLW